ncbi:MAG: hypothetical protein K0R18_117 [Bacillales bacterium]|jgi:hypothetical protein|nr:hypothetical protein [Bacillales bacterium]
MKAIGMPPSDPRVRQMNDAQWLWCYFNQIEDEKEEAENWKARFDYLTWFINYDMAKSVSDHNEKNKATDKKGTQGPRYKVEDLHRSSDFEKEAYAATKGYDPEDGLTVDEFIEQLQSNKQGREADIVNDSFEDLLASGDFSEVMDATQGVGNPNETLDDFITRALMLEEHLEDKAIEINEENLRHNNGNSFNGPPTSENHHTIDDDDLDIFEVDDDE